MRTTHHVGDSFAQNVDHLAHDTPLSAFFAEVVCTLGATPPQTATSPPRTSTSPPPHGGNCTIRATTRRRHAEGMLLMVQNPHHCPWCHAPQLLQDCPAGRGLNALARHLQSKAIQARERAQIRTVKGGIRRVVVFQMDGVGTSIIGRPRPLPGHDMPNPTQHPYTLTREEPVMCPPGTCGALFPCEAGPHRQACTTSAGGAPVPRRRTSPPAARQSLGGPPPVPGSAPVPGRAATSPPAARQSIGGPPPVCQ